MFFSAATIVILAGSATARMCMNMTVPVPVMARNSQYNNIQTPQNPIDAETFFQNMTRQGANFSAIAATGFQNIQKTFNISAMYCQPNNGSAKTLQILTHGIGFDKSYWDLPYNGYNYSYISNAVDTHGYSTLSYDRAGIGNSSHGDPTNEIQTVLETQVLAQLTMMVKNGTFGSIKSKFDKYVHVGHSFGSVQTFLLSALYPTITNGIVLTGFSANASFLPDFLMGGNFVLANRNQPFRFGSMEVATGLQAVLQNYQLTNLVAPVDLTTLSTYNYPNGYFASSDTAANQFLFFMPGGFDPNILYFAEKTKQPVTTGELLTIGNKPPTSMFAGPAMVISGSGDLPFCGGNCTATGGSMPSIPAGVKMGLPQAKNFFAYVQPNTGHGINFHYNSTGAYNVIANYLSSNGLSASA